MARSSVRVGGLTWMVAACVAALGAGAVRAQSGPVPVPGDRVRLASPTATGDFVVGAVRADSLMVRQDSISLLQPIDVSSIYRLEIYHGQTSRLWGFLGGTVAGGVLGGLSGLPCTNRHFVCESVSPRERIYIGAGVGALAGVLLWGGRDRWVQARLVGGSSLVANGPGADRSSSAASSADVISERELQERSVQQEDAYTVVQRLHPNWLRARMSAGLTGARIYPVVFLNGSRYGEVARLRDFRVTEIRSIEYIGPQNATTQFGTAYGGGVVMVRTKG